jgi:hypothetical protein
MRLRGVEKHYRFLLNLGFVPSTAHAFLRGTVSLIKLEQIEKLCVALNCTPNDLLRWQSGPNQMVAETHSLNNLKKKADKDLPELLGEIPMEKFEQIVDILQDLKN